jgi:ketosteroid isomerase-like protein
VPEESTTPDLEEATRRTSDALNRRDWDAFCEMWAPDAVWDTSPASGLLGAYEGRDAIRGAIEDWIAPYEDWEQGLEEFHDLGNGVAVAVLVQRGRLPASSEAVALRFANVSTWADGLIERVTVYTDIGQARADAERLAEERG